MDTGAYPIIGIPLYRAERHPHTNGEPDTAIQALGAIQLHVGIDRFIQGRVTL
jgi:hypothetical protein